MSEQQHGHSTEDELHELALGTLSSAEQSWTLLHVEACASCRTTYDEAVRTLDGVLAASPAIAPPPGFETRVLAGMGFGEQDSPTIGSRRRLPPFARSRGRLVLAAAAVLVGMVAGGLATAALRDAPPATTSADVAPALRTPDGTTVGTVHRSRYRDHPVLVVHVQGAPPGARYTCRLRLADGSTTYAGSWTVSASGDSAWVMPAPAGATGVQMLTDSGAVWATADISG